MVLLIWAGLHYVTLSCGQLAGCLQTYWSRMGSLSVHQGCLQSLPSFWGETVWQSLLAPCLNSLGFLGWVPCAHPPGEQCFVAKEQPLWSFSEGCPWATGAGSCESYILLSFWPQRTACRVNSLTRDQTQAPAMKVLSPNHWTTRKLLSCILLADL